MTAVPALNAPEPVTPVNEVGVVPVHEKGAHVPFASAMEPVPDAGKFTVVDTATVCGVAERVPPG
jgi:hypothetical protein